MSIKGIIFALTVFGALALPSPAATQDLKGRLATVKSIKCTFPLMTVGTWTATGAPKADVKPPSPTLVLQFESINTDEGSAQLNSNYGKYDIIVRYSGVYLHFIQSFLDGPLHTTTILEKATATGKLKAMHSRHEFNDFALTGFTSSPEQYVGDCEILK